MPRIASMSVERAWAITTATAWRFVPFMSFCCLVARFLLGWLVPFAWITLSVLTGAWRSRTAPSRSYWAAAATFTLPFASDWLNFLVIRARIMTSSLLNTIGARRTGWTISSLADLFLLITLLDRFKLFLEYLAFFVSLFLSTRSFLFFLFALSLHQFIKSFFLLQFEIERRPKIIIFLNGHCFFQFLHLHLLLLGLNMHILNFLFVLSQWVWFNLVSVFICFFFYLVLG